MTPATLVLNLINPAPTTVPLLLCQLHHMAPPSQKGTDTTPLPAKDERRADLPTTALTTFYRGVIESILTSSLSVWHGSRQAED